MTLPIADLALSGPYFNSDGTPNVAGLQLLRVINAVKARTGGIMSEGVSEAEATATGGATQTLAEWMADVEAATASVAALSARTLTAGLGISGGGDLSADRSFAFAPSELTNTAATTSDFIVLGDQSAAEAPIKRTVSSFLSDVGVATTSRVLTAGLGISGGGDLSADRTFAFDPSELTDVAIVTGDGLVFMDVSDSNNPKRRTVSSLITDLSLAQLNAANTWTVANIWTQGSASTTPTGQFINTTDAASVRALRIEGDRATPATNDEVYASFYLSNASGTQIEFARLVATASNITAGAEGGAFIFYTSQGGALASRLILTSTLLRTPNNDTMALGDATRSFSDAFFATGALIGFGNGNVVWTHSSGFMNLSTGALQVGGVAVRVAGKTGVPVPAGAMVARTTNGAAAGLTEGGTNRVMLATYDFDASTDEYVQFQVPAMPKSWNESTITARFIWTATNTGNVIWGIQGVALSDDDPFDGAFGTAQTVTDGVTAANDVMKSAETSAVTIGGSPAEGDMVVFQVYRNASNGSDTCAVDAKLIGVELFVTTNAANDA